MTGRRSPESIYGDDAITNSAGCRRRLLSGARLLRLLAVSKALRLVRAGLAGRERPRARGDPGQDPAHRRAVRHRPDAGPPCRPPALRPHLRRSGPGDPASAAQPRGAGRRRRADHATPDAARRGHRVGAAELRLFRDPGHRRRPGARRAGDQPGADRGQRRRRRRRPRLRGAEPDQGLHRRDRHHPRGPVRRRRRRRSRGGQRHRRGGRSADHPAPGRQRGRLVRPQRRGAAGRQQEPGLRAGRHRHAGGPRHRPRAGPRGHAGGRRRDVRRRRLGRGAAGRARVPRRRADHRRGRLPAAGRPRHQRRSVAGRAGAAHAAQGTLRGRGHPDAAAAPGRVRRRPGGCPLTAPAPDGVTPTGEEQATFREVFAVREFRPLFGTFLLSTAGDELARVALTVLVYQRTSSPLLSALTFAIGYLPWLLGGPLLSAFADRLPRHRVLIATDAARAVLLAGMATPGMPLPAMLVLLFLVSLGSPPFESARSALMADVLDGDRYAVATSLTNITLQLAQVVGFVVAGALVAALNPSAALLIDAATFAVSAVWLWARLQRRPAPVSEAGGEPRTLLQDTADGLRLIGGSPRLLAIVGVLWAATMFAYAAEGVAAPWVDQLGQGATALGVLLAANPLGVIVGGLVIARLVAPSRRERLVVPLVVLSLAPVLLAGLAGIVLGPGSLPFRLVVGLLFVSGIGAAWTIPLNVSFVQAVPSAFRGRAFGVAVSGLYGVQGVGAMGAGLMAEGGSAGGAVAVCGGRGPGGRPPRPRPGPRAPGAVAGVVPREGPSES